MPLTQEQEEREHELRMELMIMSIDQARFNIEKMRNDLRYEARKFALQAIVAAAACVGAGIAIANWVNSRYPLPAPPAATAPATRG